MQTLNYSLRISLACGCLLALFGCSHVDSVHPLSDKATQTTDDRLVGRWKIVDPNAVQPASEAVAAANDSASVLIIKKLGEEYLTESASQQQMMTLLPTKIGEQLYLSVRATKPGGAENNHLLVRYQWINEKEFRLYFISPVTAAKAIEAQQIAGVVSYQPNQKGSPQPEVQIARFTAPTAALREFLATPAGAAMFSLAEPGLILRKDEKQ